MACFGFRARGGDDDDWFDIHYRTRSRSHSPSPKGKLCTIMIFIHYSQTYNRIDGQINKI